jgi:signal transduction histidine kinase
MGARMRAYDWAATPVGTPSTWPAHLTALVGMCLRSRLPMAIWWGREHLTTFYNDAYIQLLGLTKHPGWLGRSARDCWKELWPTVGPILDSVFDTGVATWSENGLAVLHRNLPLEEVYVTMSYSPIVGPRGTIDGIFCACQETTAGVLGARRLKTSRDLADRSLRARTREQACELATQVLAQNNSDIPFSLVYLLDEARVTGRLVSTSGLRRGQPATPEQLSVAGTADDDGWPLYRVVEASAPWLANPIPRGTVLLPDRRWPEAPGSALLLPLMGQNPERVIGVLICGISPRRTFDRQYRDFFVRIAEQLSASLVNAQEHETASRLKLETARDIAESTYRESSGHPGELTYPDRDELFAMLAHELRNPLSAIQNSMTALGHFAGEHAHAEDLRSLMTRQLSHLSRMVDDLLDLSRVNAGKLVLERRPLDLAETVRQCVEQLRSAGRLQQHDVRIDVAPVFVDADPIRLDQVVGNLLDNALKYTPAGGRVTVSCRGDNGVAMLRVQDTGVGIAAEDLPRLFQPFMQVSRSLELARGGLGLGLALVRRLIWLHGGTVSATSGGVGLGTELTLHMPKIAAPQAVAEPVHIESPRPTARRVLIIEDDADVRVSLNSLLRALGHHVEEAPDGEEGLRKLLTMRPDLALIDIGIPSLDGYALARTVRESELGKDLLLVALTGYGGPEHRERARRAGFDLHLAKPIQETALLDLLAHAPQLLPLCG